MRFLAAVGGVERQRKERKGNVSRVVNYNIGLRSGALYKRGLLEMTEAQKAAIRRQIEELEVQVEVLKLNVTIWPGVNVSRERDRAEREGFERQIGKINHLVSSIELSIKNMLPVVERERPPHPDCSVCDGNGWVWGGERGEQPENCDCEDAYDEERCP